MHVLLFLFFLKFKFTHDYLDHETKILKPEEIVMNIYEKEKQLSIDQLKYFDSCKFQSILLLQIKPTSFIFSKKITDINTIYNKIFKYVASEKIFISSQKHSTIFDSAENQFFDFIKNSVRANTLLNKNLTRKKEYKSPFQDRTFYANILYVSKFLNLNNLIDKKDLILLGNFDNQIDIFGLIFTQFKERIISKYESEFTNVIMVLNSKTDNNLLSILQDFLQITDVDYSILLKNHNTLKIVNLDKPTFLKDLIYVKKFFSDISDLYKKGLNTENLLSSKSVYYKIESIIKCEFFLGTNIFLDQYFQHSPKIYCYIIKLNFGCFNYTFNIFFADYNIDDKKNQNRFLERIAIIYGIDDYTNFALFYDLILGTNDIEAIRQLPKIQINDYENNFKNKSYADCFKFLKFFEKVVSLNLFNFNFALTMSQILNGYDRKFFRKMDLKGFLLRIKRSISYIEFVSLIMNNEFKLFPKSEIQIFNYEVYYSECKIKTSDLFIHFDCIGMKNLIEVDKIDEISSYNHRYMIVFKHEFNQEIFNTFYVFPKEEIYYQYFLEFHKKKFSIIETLIKKNFKASNYDKFSIEIIKRAIIFVFEYLNELEIFLICTQYNCNVDSYDCFILFSLLYQYDYFKEFINDSFIEIMIEKINKTQTEDSEINFKQTLNSEFNELYKKFESKHLYLYLQFDKFKNFIELIFRGIKIDIVTKIHKNRKFAFYIKFYEHNIYHEF